LNINSPVELLAKGKTTIKNMLINKGGMGQILLSEETIIEDLLVDDIITLKGNGKINTMKVKVPGVQSEIQPAKIVASGHKIELPNKKKSNNHSSNNKISKDKEVSEEEESFEAQRIGQSVVDLTFTQTGNQISDHKLGFYPPTDFDEQPDDFQGWLLVYSKHNFNTVWSEMKDLSHETIEEYSETGENQRVYQVTNYGWADGLGNTFRANQKDLVTGNEFGPGLNHFYVATYTSDGILGLAEADEVINILPYPKDILLHGLGETINDYSITFDSYDDERIEKNFFFYSEKGIYEIQDIVKDVPLETVETWANENKGILTDDKSGEIAFKANQKTILGNDFDLENYYVYGVAISDEGVLEVSWTKEMILNKPIPSPSTEILNDGKGIVLPAGGSTSSSSSDSEDFYEYIRESTGEETPRIAIFSSSRDNFETVYNHYYFDDPTYGSLEDNFEDLGFEPVFMPLAIDNAYFYADNIYYSELIKTCDAVFLQGGDQNKHARALLNDGGSDTKMMEAIRYVYDRGGILSGTSAGMAVMGEYAYGYGIPSVVLETNQTEDYSIADVPLSGDLFPIVDNNNLTIPGIGLVPNEVLNDTHFDARGRFGRLVVAMRDTNKTIGIGADEGTGLAIQENIGTVIGHQGIFIADASAADYLDGEIFNVTDLTLHYLTKGDKYNFETGEVTPASEKTLSTTSDEPLEISEDIFKGDYEFTKRLLDFSMSTEDSIEHSVKTSNEPFFITQFRKTDTTEVYTSEGNYLDNLLKNYKQSTIINLTVDVVEDDSVDTTSPTITDFSYDLPEKPYTVYFMISDDKSGIDPLTVTQKTVLLSSETNTIYSSSPEYDPGYGDIKVSIEEDNYITGDIVTFEGIKDLSGNVMPTESWIFEEDTWQKLDKALDLKAPEILSIDQSADYTVYLQLADDLSGINTETINQTTVKIESDVNTIFESSPVYDEGYNDIKVSITEDAYIAGDRIVIEGIEDNAGNTIEAHQWVYDGSDWTKEGMTEVIIDEEAPVINDVYLSSNYDDTTYINITDDIGIDEASITTGSVIFISDENTLYKAPEYDQNYDEIEIRINETAFTTGSAITIDGINDTSNNTVEKQTWQFNGIEWIKE
ncbi:MAG TPA: cyanophycinase, partial [Clostridia bacterium]|nr:cyanophycinase [Clostridia bacterium]